MNTLDIYTLRDIVSYFDIDTKLCVKNVNKCYKEIIGRIKFTIVDKHYHYITTYDEQPVRKLNGTVLANGVLIGALNGSIRIIMYAWNTYGIDECSFIAACRSGNLDCVRLTIGDRTLCPLYCYEEHNIDVTCSICNFIDSGSTRILNNKLYIQRGFEIACENNHYEVSRWLLEHGAINKNTCK